MRTGGDHNEDKVGLIEELELSEPNGITRVQVRDAIKLRAGTWFEAGSASQRTGEPVLAETRELSPRRLRMVGRHPMAVGDVYRMRFDQDALPLPESHVLCVACRLLPDGDYEHQCEFFAPVDLAQLEGNA